MEKEDRSLWVILAGIVVFALWYTLTRRTENALWLVLAAICFLILAYRFYGAFAAARAVALNEQESPSGADMLPTPAWVAFGYQFAAIAGVGVLVGPVLAAQYGYLPGYLWILLAAMLAGAVHDFVVLVASQRRKAAFLPALVATELGPWAGLAAWALALAALVALLAVTGSYAATLLTGNLWALYAVAVTVVIAALVSAYEMWLRPGMAGEAIALGILLSVLAVLAGARFAGVSLEGSVLSNRGFVLLVLGAYVVLSAVAPLRMLGRARVAISGYLTLGAGALLALAIAFAAPSLRQPATTTYVSGGGPLLSGSLLPYLALIMGAGVLSGLNSLAATATTSRLVKREADTLPVGFGAALAQALFVALILISVSTLHRWDFYALSTAAPAGDIERLAQNGQRDWDTLRGVLKSDTLRIPGGVVATQSADNARQSGGATAVSASATWMLRTMPGVKQAWLSTIYRFMFVLQALIVVAVLEAAMRATRVAAEQVGAAVATAGRAAGDVRVTRIGAAATLLLISAVWLVLASKADLLRTYMFLAFVSLLLASVGLGAGWIAVRARAGRASGLVAATFLAVTVLAGVAGIVCVRDSAPFVNRSKALAQVYSELPRWAAAYPAVNPDRARDVVRQWPAADFSRLYMEQGQAVAARELQNRLGLPEADASRLSAAVGTRATGLSLWSWLQLVLTLLLFVLALAIVVGRWVRVPLALPRRTAVQRAAPPAAKSATAPQETASPKAQPERGEGPDFEI